MTPEESDKAQALLDIPMLEQYIELVGPKLITDGLAVFEKNDAWLFKRAGVQSDGA